MSKESNVLKVIPRLYKRSYEHIGMFFWVEAQKQLVPTITIAQAIHNYYKMIDEEYDYNVAIVIFSRLRAELIDLNYDKFCNENTEKDS